MKQKKKLKTLVFILMGIFCIWLGLLAHEFVHQIAFEIDDINSEVKFEYGFPAYVKPEQNCESKECVLINGFNEVIGYNIFQIIMLLIIGFSIIIYILDNRK